MNSMPYRPNDREIWIYWIAFLYQETRLVLLRYSVEFVTEFSKFCRKGKVYTI